MLDVMYYDEDNNLQRKGFENQLEYNKWLDENPNISVIKVKY